MPFDKEGHRGCRGLMPENTIPAMLKALELRVTTLEMDVVISKDKKVVVSHDPFFSHEITTKPDGSYVTEAEEKWLNIYRMDYEEVEKFDVGLKPHPRFPNQKKIPAIKPLLESLIDNVEKYTEQKHLSPVHYNIETKSTSTTDGIFHPAPTEFVNLLMQVIIQKGIQDRCIIQSFDIRTLQYLHTRYPKIKSALLIEEDDHKPFKQQVEELGFTPTIYSPAHQLVTDTLIDECHNHHILIIPWTINEKSRIDELRKKGVDGIITDYPNLF